MNGLYNSTIVLVDDRSFEPILTYVLNPLGCPAVITMAAHVPDQTSDNVPVPEALKRLEDQGADVVGLNCSRGPEIMMSLLKQVKEVCKVDI